MSYSTLSRARFRKLVADAALRAEDEGLSSGDRVRLINVANTTTVCGVGTFGSMFEPLDCQCPATQARLLPSAPGVESFGSAFDRDAATVTNNLYVTSIRVID
jgi:hypothetical protein